MTDWEDRYRRGEMPWEKGRPHPALVEFLRRDPVRGRVLVPGCGFGHDVRTLAATADDVVGVDIAPSAVRSAKNHPAVGGEKYELGDFFNLKSAHHGAFDWVFEHTCFCAIPPELRAHYVAAAAGALRTGGRLLAIFYMNPQMDPGESGPPFGSSRADLDSLFGGAFTLEREWVPATTYEGREGRELCRLLTLR